MNTKAEPLPINPCFVFRTINGTFIIIGDDYQKAFNLVPGHSKPNMVSALNAGELDRMCELYPLATVGAML